MINLLPPEEKEIVLTGQKQRTVLILGTMLLIFLVNLYLASTLIRIQLKSMVDSEQVLLQAASSEIVSSGGEAIRQKIITYNQELDFVQNIYGEQARTGDILRAIAELLPSGMRLKTFSYNGDSSLVALSGFAFSREGLFELKNRLESSEVFQEVDFPPSNWIKPRNIDFKASFKLK